ncbi:MAG: hypothetical protein KC636_31705 [Myxococcales bacterium]|nr:hypothetical protein [Myxococcales bacterium]
MTAGLALALAIAGCGDSSGETEASATETSSGTQTTTTMTSSGTDPTTAGPGTETSASSDPSATDPSATDPSATDPSATDPSATDPSATDPSATDPTTDPSETETDTEGTNPGCLVDGHYFPDGAIWYQDHSAAPVHPDSNTIVTWLEGAGWGGGDQFRVDFSIEVLTADANTPKIDFIETGDFYSPDCDHVPMPVPPGGAIEGEQGYVCEGDGDCHLIVADSSSCVLYEMWRANYDGQTFEGGCLALWFMDQVYPDTGRGDGCTSADAAGFPIAPLLFSADEVASGEIDHAIRFILPNANIRHLVYVPPCTHSTNPTSGSDEAPPYGVHMRLRADYDVDALPNEGAKVVARALQKYGMFLADGGQIALTAQSDRFTTNKWEGLLGPYDLVDIRPMDFEVIDHGGYKTWNGDLCDRAPITMLP